VFKEDVEGFVFKVGGKSGGTLLRLIKKIGEVMKKDSEIQPEKRRPGSMFRDARDQLQAIELAEKKFQRELFKKCDWNDPKDVAHYKKLKRIDARNRVIKRLCPDRKCPSCGRIVLQTNSWVINKKESEAICRSCYFRLINNQVPDKVQELNYNIFIPERYSINGQLLLQTREKTELSLKEFARLAGWGRSYQTKLENNEIKSISGDIVNILIAVLNDNGVTTLDTLK